MQLHQCLLWQCWLQGFRGDKLHGAAHSQPGTGASSIESTEAMNGKYLNSGVQGDKTPFPASSLFLRKMSCGHCLACWNWDCRFQADLRVRSSKEHELMSLVNGVSHYLVFDDLHLEHESLALCLILLGHFMLALSLALNFLFCFFWIRFEKLHIIRHCHLDIPYLRQLFPSVDYFLSPFMDSGPDILKFWSSDVWC